MEPIPQRLALATISAQTGIFILAGAAPNATETPRRRSNATSPPSRRIHHGGTERLVKPAVAFKRFKERVRASMGSFSSG
jgi:hypothetical protein